LIGVLDALDKSMPIGITSAIGRTEDDLAVWGLRVNGADVPGRSSSIDGLWRPRDLADESDSTLQRRQPSLRCPPGHSCWRWISDMIMALVANWHAELDDSWGGKESP